RPARRLRSALPPAARAGRRRGAAPLARRHPRAAARRHTRRRPVLRQCGAFHARRARHVPRRARTEARQLAGGGAASRRHRQPGVPDAAGRGPGGGAFVYGAMLTPKGMIVVDGWATRHDTTVSYTVPAHGRERALEILTRSVPPRLARLADRTAELAVLRLMGPRAQAVAEEAGLEVPSMVGRAVQSVTGDAGADVARPGDAAPFALQISLPADRAHAVRERLVAGGALWADPDALEFARILAGWPALGAEVDDRTIPQEVRYDELGGVSYTKGCYTGQETVSRLHFRGHTNRYLRGLMFDAEPAATPAPGWTAVTHLDRDVARVTSLAWAPEAGVAGGGMWLGLALVRREVLPGTAVRAAGRHAHVGELPLALPA